MYNIVEFNRKKHTILMSRKINFFEMTDEKQLFHQLDSFDGIVIHHIEGEDRNKLFGLLLNIKRQNLLPIWIREERRDKLSRKLTAELGTLASFDYAISDEELVCVIENTLDLIHHRNQDDSKNGKKYSNKAKLNTLNKSIMFPDKSEIHLTQLEYKLFSLLSSRVNQAHDYEAIYNHVWFSESRKEDTNKKYRIANLVFHIRRKFEENGVNPNILRTVRSVGYLLDTSIDESYH